LGGGAGDGGGSRKLSVRPAQQRYMENEKKQLLQLHDDAMVLRRESDERSRDGYLILC